MRKESTNAGLSDEQRKLKEEADKALDRGKYRRAAEAYDKLATLDADPRWLHKAGEAYRRAGALAEALDRLTVAARAFASRGFTRHAIATAKIILDIVPADNTATQMLSQFQGDINGRTPPPVSGELVPVASEAVAEIVQGLPARSEIVVADEGDDFVVTQAREVAPAPARASVPQPVPAATPTRAYGAAPSPRRAEADDDFVLVPLAPPLGGSSQDEEPAGEGDALDDGLGIDDVDMDGLIADALAEVDDDDSWDVPFDDAEARPAAPLDDSDERPPRLHAAFVSPPVDDHELLDAAREDQALAAVDLPIEAIDAPDVDDDLDGIPIDVHFDGTVAVQGAVPAALPVELGDFADAAEHTEEHDPVDAARLAEMLNLDTFDEQTPPLAQVVPLRPHITPRPQPAVVPAIVDEPLIEEDLEPPVPPPAPASGPKGRKRRGRSAAPTPPAEDKAAAPGGNRRRRRK